MKDFDLEKALQGEPVMLRNGDKAFIFKNILGTPILDFKPDYPLIGMIHNHPVTQTWSLDGRISSCNDCAPGDIVGMWEEPKISIEDLPKPFYPEESNGYFYISDGKVAYNLYHSKYSESSLQIASNGQSFRTREDVQKWLDFMKSMME
ncbi:hypothetical protein [uncultured Haemophilus sp.]|uniref:hypothetical protein n=1 Tax=uncultured Haemophilus sp. TaxID=237779 RepID=UPI002615B7BB|nr:hypothetical protein [uncultured Haemophilus sp.]